MGASQSINRMYKVRSSALISTVPLSKRLSVLQIALLFSAFLQLAAFFTILAIGMWIDLLSCYAVAVLAGDVRSDQAAFLVLAVVSKSVLGFTPAILTTAFQVLAPWMISVWSLYVF